MSSSAAATGSTTRLIDVENPTEEELDILHGYYQELAQLARKDQDMTESHSIEEARLHSEKQR